MTQIFVLNSAFGLMTAVAALDSGAIPDAAGPRILLTVNAAAVPETSPSLDEMPHLEPLLRRFDRVEPLAAVVAPTLPTQWEPAPEDLPMIERLLRRAWRIGDDPVALFLQSPQVPPARTAAAVFPAAEITVVGDGLMTYAPLRTTLPASTLARAVEVVYADIVPGVAPLVLSERGIRRTAVPLSRFGNVLTDVAARIDDPALDRLSRGGVPTALILGQYLATLGLVSTAEERAMQVDMIDRALSWNPERVVFKPHPSAPPSLSEALIARARERDLDVVVYDGEAPAEVVAERIAAVGVVAGFSTALPTVHALRGTPIAAVGTVELLARFSPYENSNRMPVTIVDALVHPPTSVPLADLVAAVGFTMQPRLMRHLEAGAVATVAAMTADERERWIGRRRLTELGLPGGDTGVVARVRNAPVAVTRVEQARLVARGARRRLSRAWREVKGR
jgi:hypothetical protein